MIFQIINILHLFFITFTFGWVIKQVLEYSNIYPTTTRPSFDWLCIWGFVGLVTILQIAHLFVPINGVFQAIVSTICLIICLISRKSILKSGYFPKASTIPTFIIHHSSFIIPIGILFFFALMESVEASKINDTFLYHQTSVRWINELPIVKGLANVHIRFGFNSTMFLASAFFSGRWLAAGDLLPSVNIFFFLLLILRGGYEIQKALKSAQYFTVFFNLSFIFILFFQLKAFFSGISVDLTSAVLFYFLMLAFSKMTDNESQKLNFVHLVFLAFLLPTLKLSQLTFVLALFLVGFYYRWYIEKRAWLLVVVTGFLLIIPWLGRTLLLTGYPLFPSMTLDFFPVDWKVPATSPADSTTSIQSVFAVKSVIQSWARIPEGHFSTTLALPFSTWIPIWIRNQSLFTNILIGLAFASPLAMGILFFLKRRRGNNKNNLVQNASFENSPFTTNYEASKQHHSPFTIHHSSSILAFVNVVFWFFSAPDFRFAAGSIIFCSLYCLQPFFIFLSKKLHQKLILTTALAFFLYIFYVELIKKSTRITAAELSEIVVFPKKYAPPILIKKSVNNCEYYIPDVNSNCGDTPLPCTPYENSRLILRGSTVSDGFRIIE